MPWDEVKFGGDTQSAQYEAWRREHYCPERVLADIADAAQYVRRTTADKGFLAAVGFCFGGGRLLEAVAGGCDLGGKVTMLFPPYR